MSWIVWCRPVFSPPRSEVIPRLSDALERADYFAKIYCTSVLVSPWWDDHRVLNTGAPVYEARP